MDGWQGTSFGQLNAADYDAKNDPGTTDECVAFIAELAGAGRVLELAVGSGRIALPLAAQGINIEGQEISPEMVDLLRAKPGGAELKVTLADMADVGVDGPFDHVFLVFNTLFNLTSQAAQLACFRNVAARLAPGGTFLVETFVPDLTRFTDHQDVRIKAIGMDMLGLDAVEHDPVLQTLTMQRMWVNGDQTRLIPLLMRYAFPPELDMMAACAGLTLAQRWGGWKNEPFTRDSKMHVSVWEKPA